MRSGLFQLKTKKSLLLMLIWMLLVRECILGFRHLSG